jgi:hypothetical protein
MQIDDGLIRLFAAMWAATVGALAKQWFEARKLRKLHKAAVNGDSKPVLAEIRAMQEERRALAARHGQVMGALKVTNDAINGVLTETSELRVLAEQQHKQIFELQQWRREDLRDAGQLADEVRRLGHRVIDLSRPQQQ